MGPSSAGAKGQSFPGILTAAPEQLSVILMDTNTSGLRSPSVCPSDCVRRTQGFFVALFFTPLPRPSPSLSLSASGPTHMAEHNGRSVVSNEVKHGVCSAGPLEVCYLGLISGGPHQLMPQLILL